MTNKNEIKSVRLGDVCDIYTGGEILIKNLTDDKKYQVVNGGSSTCGTTDTFNMAGDTVTVSEHGSAGKVLYMSDDFFLGQHAYGIRPRDGAGFNAKYLYVYLKSIEKFLVEHGDISVVSTLKRDILENLMVPICSDETMALIEDLILLASQCERLCNNTKKLAENIFINACSEFFAEKKEVH